MSKICVEEDKSMSQLNGKNNDNPVHVCIDGEIFGDLLYKDVKVFEVPAGRHSISLWSAEGDTRYVKKFSCKALDIEITDGETVNIVCYADTIAHKAYFSDRKDTAVTSRFKKIGRRSGARQSAVGVVYAIGIISLTFGLLVLFSDYFSDFGLNGMYMAVLGLVFIILGILSGKTNIALIIATVIYGVDTYITLASLITFTVNMQLNEIIVLWFLYLPSTILHVGFIIVLIKGVVGGILYKMAFRKLKNAR